MARVSSNAFAQGSNQNCGNFLTDTPTSRVLAPPGGRSSFSLGFDDASHERKSQHRNRQKQRDDSECGSTTAGSSYACSTSGHSDLGSDNRSCVSDTRFGQRVRTTSNSFARGANQNCGNMITDVPTTKVHAPPGGRSSLSLGWDGSDRGNTVRGQRESRRKPPASDAGSSYACSNSGYSAVGADNHSRVSDTRFGQRSRTTSNAFACGANQNCGNMITDVPTTKVHAPPGGRSSLSLGWDVSDRGNTGQGQRQSCRRPPASDAGSSYACSNVSYDNRSRSSCLTAH